MRAAVLVLVVGALLAGCVTPSASPHLRVGFVGAPQLADVFPNASELPGFVLGWEQASGADGDAQAALTRLYDHEGDSATIQHRLSASVMLFGTPDEAQHALDNLVRSGGGAQQAGPDLYVIEGGNGSMDRPEGSWQSQHVYGRADAYVIVFGEDARGAPPLVDSVAMAREMLYRLTANGAR